MTSIPDGSLSGRPRDQRFGHEHALRALPDDAAPPSGATGRGRLRRLRLAALLAATAVALGSLAVATDTLGIGGRFERLQHRIALIVTPIPDRPTVPTIEMTPAPPVASASGATSGRAQAGGADSKPAKGATSPGAAGAFARGSAGASGNPGDGNAGLGASAGTAAGPATSPAGSRSAARRPVDMTIVSDPRADFASEQQDVLCAPAGVQIVLTILGLGNTSASFQYGIDSRIGEWQSWRDSHDGGWGPAAIVEALDAYGAHGYQVRAYATRDDALRDTAEALTNTREPVLLMAWRGAHTWVMSGYRATADPTIVADAQITGTYILDPWYPRISSIWGPSDPPGTFQGRAEMIRNYLPWQRPEGLYPDRDGRFIAIVPTLPAISIARSSR